MSTARAIPASVENPVYRAPVMTRWRWPTVDPDLLPNVNVPTVSRHRPVYVKVVAMMTTHRDGSG